MQNELFAVLAPTGNHTWSITIGGVTDEGFRAFWHGEGRTEFRRTEAGDVEHVIVSGLQDDFQKTEAALEAPVLSLSHPEMWRKTEAGPEQAAASVAPAQQEPSVEPAGGDVPPAPSSHDHWSAGAEEDDQGAQQEPTEG